MEIVTEKTNKNLLEFKEAFFLQLNLIANNKKIFFLILGIIFSYYYNLPVLKYSIKGDNELRLYDVLGIFVLYYFKINYSFYKLIIYKIYPFKVFLYLLIWSSITILVTLFFSIIKDRLVWFVQSVLYLYHFYLFYISSIIFYVVCYNKSNLLKYVKFIIYLSIISCVIVIMQNLNIIPFLWSEEYKIAYSGFLSGTLGPNKIVLGMTTFMSFCLSIGLLMNDKIKINKLLLIITALLNVYVLLLSGSRTSYIALLVFLLFFAYIKTSKFIIYGFVSSLFFIFIISFNGNLLTKVSDVINNRVVERVKNEDDLKNVNVGNLYEDLGAGRDKLSLDYIRLLLEYPAVIPFGVGFNNRIAVKGSSAHNMYLNVIKELGIIGFILYFGWLISYFFLKLKHRNDISFLIKGLVFASLVALFFGEHLYIYRPVFSLLGLFLIIINLFLATAHSND